MSLNGLAHLIPLALKVAYTIIKLMLEGFAPQLYGS